MRKLLFLWRALWSLYADKVSIHRYKGKRAVSKILSAYPAPFETVLRAEEAVEAHLQACRTLKRSSILSTFGAETFSGCRNFSGHSCYMNGN